MRAAATTRAAPASPRGAMGWDREILARRAGVVRLTRSVPCFSLISVFDSSWVGLGNIVRGGTKEFFLFGNKGGNVRR